MLNFFKIKMNQFEKLDLINEMIKNNEIIVYDSTNRIVWTDRQVIRANFNEDTIQINVGNN